MIKVERINSLHLKKNKILIMSKVKINPKYPVNPGMTDEKLRIHTLEWDMLDDVSRFPTKEQLQNYPRSAGSPFYSIFNNND